MAGQRSLDSGNENSTRKAKSFLVRLWVEAEEAAEGERVIRAYIRDLHTGEEQYTATPEEILRFFLRRLEQESEQVVGEIERKEEKA